MGRGGRLLAAAGIVTALCGCGLFGPEEASFRSNRDLLGDFARTTEYVVADDLFRLVAIHVEVDSLVFQYRGEAHIGDAAWVVRFSVKSSEQSPEELADVFRVFKVLGEERPGFAYVDEGQGVVGPDRVDYVRYRFDSPVRDENARPFPAHGIVATLLRQEGGEQVVYHFKLDNHGDRADVVWEDLRPLLDPLRKP